MTPTTLPAPTNQRKTHRRSTADRPRDGAEDDHPSPGGHDGRADTTILVIGATMTVESATIHPIRRIYDPDNPFGDRPMIQPSDPDDSPDIAVEAGGVPK